jgi:hypothetical protein
MKLQCWAKLAAASLLVIVQGSGHAGAILESFDRDPIQRGWRVFGDNALFSWDAGAGRLSVTWDSSRPNSYFHLPLETVLTKEDAFSISFSIQLEEIAIGTTPGKPLTFEIALGFLNLATATTPEFLRGTGYTSPNLVEWNFFPDSGFGATLCSVMISKQHQWATGFSAPWDLLPGQTYRFRLEYEPTGQRMSLSQVLPEGLSPIHAFELEAKYDDFRVDTLAVCSYSDAGQDPQWSGSILARGIVDDIEVVLPHPPVQDMTLGAGSAAWQVEFGGRAKWLYTLEASEDFVTWTSVASATALEDGRMTISDPGPVSGRCFYRVRAERP